MRGRWRDIAATLFIFVAVLGGGEYALLLAEQRATADRRGAAVAAASALGTSLSHELASVLYLNSGLRAYLISHDARLEPGDIDRTLSILYASARHVRNFGVAVGYRVMYIYPREGNEKAIGLYYPDVKDQWPAVQRAGESRQPARIGPVRLVQGGQGLIYRVPIHVGERYWGLISTVIDSDALFASALKRVATGEFDFAIRGKESGEVFLGDPQLFKRAATVDLEVPGGKWTMAAQPAKELPGHPYLVWLRVLVAALAAVLAWGVYLTLVQHRRFGQMAMYDALTGLPNRSLIEDRFDQVIARHRRDPGTTAALLFIDLDGFKTINQNHGHKAGDAVLRGVAAKLASTVRDTDSVGRWGGDEFVVLLEGATEGSTAEWMGRLREVLQAPQRQDGEELRVGASIGVSRMPADGMELADLVRLADSRMYSDKQERRARR